MSILKSTHSGKTGILLYHLNSDKYEHKSDEVNYYYKTPYRTQPPFYVTDLSKEFYLRKEFRTGYLVTVYISPIGEAQARINTLDELELIERFWDELIKEHDDLISLHNHTLCTDKLKEMDNEIRAIAQKNEIHIASIKTKTRFRRK